jgi:Cu/Ag efflux pump CusA
LRKRDAGPSSFTTFGKEEIVPMEIAFVSGAILALTPLALGIGVGAQMQQPLAIAVIGGFIVALPLLLMVFPTLLRWVYKR